MCGIYGSINNKKNLDDYNNRLKKLEHRGPDNQSYYFGEDIFLGHTRLSILDIDFHANQPFEDDSNILIFNGEIYNYIELRKRYLKDIEFKTHSDTEVLFYLLKKFGYEIIKELNGMFAFSFFDKIKNILLIARDTMGIKPLYYILNDASFEFSSEVKSLTYLINNEKVKEFMYLRSYQNGYLPYSNVKEFPKGHYGIYEINTNELKIDKFNKIDDIPNKVNYNKNLESGFEQAKKLLDNRMNESIRLHLQSDAKIGALCSGGVDSSLISVIANMQNPNIELYHAGMEGSGGEEKYAEIVSKHIGKDINYYKVNAEEYWKNFPYLTYISDVPLYHPNDISLHYIAKKAHKDGVKVLLSGEGADELFGGYSWHQNLIKRQKIFQIYDKLPIVFNKIMKKLLFHFTKNGLNTITSKNYKNFMPLGLGYSEIMPDYLSKVATFSSNNFENWKEWHNHLSIYENFDEKNRNFALSLMHNNLHGHLGSILQRTDRILMANSIEGRVPFLENGIIDFALNLPYDYKINNNEGKYILKKVAEKYLPHSIIYRKKVGFPAPWIKHIEKIEKIFEKGFILEITGLTSNELKLFYQNDIYAKFMLISLEVWGRIFIRKEDFKSIIVE